MRYHTIKDLERLTGIKAHTIRIWEQRYTILQPERTDGNFRLYSDNELKKLLTISALINNGYKISKIALLNQSEIKDIIMALEATKDGDVLENLWINNLIKSCIDFDEVSFEIAFSHCVLKIGFENTLLKVVYPTLNKIGVMWGVGEISPAQEHFTTNLVKKKILVAIDGMFPEINSNSSTYILFLPHWEEHDLGLLFAYYLLRKNGIKIIYLGANVPIESLKEIESSKFEALVSFFVVSAEGESVQEYLKQLAIDFPDKKIFYAANYGILEENFELPGSFYRLHSPFDLVNLTKN